MKKEKRAENAALEAKDLARRSQVASELARDFAQKAESNATHIRAAVISMADSASRIEIALRELVRIVGWVDQGLPQGGTKKRSKPR